MGKVVYKDSHTNTNGCSIVEYQFESFDDFLAFEDYKQQSLIDSLKGSGLFTLAETEDFDDEPSVVNINVKKKDKETKH